MRLRNFFNLLLALPLFAAGCNNDTEILSVALSSAMESDVMKFDSEGGTGVIEGMGEYINHYPETDVTMEATAFAGVYKGQYPSNTFNYNIFLSDKGFTETDGLMAGGRYYNLDLYGLEIVTDDEGYYTIPVGTYTINEEFYRVDWSLRPNHSSYIVVNADLTGYYTYCQFDSATVVVTEDSIRLEAKSGNITYTATYNGVPKFK